MSYLINKLASAKNALLVLPEFFLGDYFEFSLIGQDKILLILKDLLDLSYANNLALVGSLPILDRDKAYNRSLYIDQGKLVGFYDKVKLYGDEARYFSAGEKDVGIFNYQGINFAVQICLDIIDPIPLAKAVRARNVDFLLVPATVSANYLLSLAKARALENQIFTVFANRSKRKGSDIHYLGKSALIYPDGSTRQVSSSAHGITVVSIKYKRLLEIRNKRRTLLKGYLECSS